MSKPTTVKEAIKNFETEKGVTAANEEKVRAVLRPRRGDPPPASTRSAAPGAQLASCSPPLKQKTAVEIHSFRLTLGALSRPESASASAPEAPHERAHHEMGAIERVASIAFARDR